MMYGEAQLRDSPPTRKTIGIRSGHPIASEYCSDQIAKEESIRRPSMETRQRNRSTWTSEANEWTIGPGMAATSSKKHLTRRPNTTCGCCRSSAIGSRFLICAPSSRKSTVACHPMESGWRTFRMRRGALKCTCGPSLPRLRDGRFRSPAASCHSWSPNGKELYYLTGSEKAVDTWNMMSVTIKTEPRFEAGIPAAIFDMRLAPNAWFDVSRDGTFPDPGEGPTLRTRRSRSWSTGPPR